MSEQVPLPHTSPAAGLTQSLSQRQLSMMGLGGAIGAGLFVGSGQSIAVAGPAVLVSYAIAGVLVILVMGMLAEMTANDPSSGAFSVFADKAFGRVAGATIGWLYWVQLVVVIAAEATAAGAIISEWVPAVPQWAWVLGFIALFTAVNLLHVAGYGTFEFWFAILKVAAIIGFLVLGGAHVFGLVPGHPSPGMSNLTGHGGFMPTGLGGVASAVLVVIFAFGGTEIVAIAAAESEDPARNVHRAVKSVVWRILVFYIGSVLLIVTALPWNSPDVAKAPFASVLKLVGIPGVDLLLTGVIIVALLSALNANLYASSRMVFSLAERGCAPQALRKVSSGGTPWVAVLASVAFGLATVVANFFWPEQVLPTLLNIVGSTLIVMWTSVAASHLVLRRRADRQGITSPAPLPLFPFSSMLALALVVVIVVLALMTTGARDQLLATVALTVVLYLVTWWQLKKNGTLDRPITETIPAQDLRHHKEDHHA